MTDNYYPNVNGASYFAQRLASGLKDQGHEVLVVAPSRFLKKEYFEYQGVRVFGGSSWYLKVMRIPTPFLSRRQAKRAIMDFKADVVHLQSHFSVGRSGFCAAREMDIPVIGTNHFMPENLVHYLHLPFGLEYLASRFAWSYFRFTFDKLDRVTAPTETAANLLRDIGIKKDVVAISNGVDLSRFNPNNFNKKSKNKFGLPNKPILLYVGRLDKEKNIDLVLRAFRSIADCVDAHFAIAGKGVISKQLKKLSDKLELGERVTFLGFVPDESLPELYACSDCYVTACTAELQSIATMEAMASGLAIVAARAMALPELVKDGENGYLFEPGDIKAMSACIHKIFSNPILKEKMSNKSLEYIKIHDINHVVDKFESVYAAAIKGHKA